MMDMEAGSNAFDLADCARAELADLIDRQMGPLGLVAMDALAPAPGQPVLDVGCGAGETILQLADRVGTSGRVIGVDIAPRVLTVAHQRTKHLPQVTLLHEDAAGLALPDRSLDAVFSRFGTMFFVDPIAAFGNLHRMLRPGGRIGFVCWRSMRENELDFFCAEAAGLPIAADGAPFCIEDSATIARELRSAGFDRIEIVAHDQQVSAGDVAATLKVVTRVGAVGKVLRDDPTLLAKAEPPLRAALTARERNGEVHLGTATWVVTATVNPDTACR